MTLAEILREAGGQVDATGQLLKGLALQPASGLGGASRTIYDLLRGEGVDKSMASGAKTVEDIQGLGGGPFTERGAQRLHELGSTIEGAEEKVGEALGHPLEKLGDVPTYGPALAAGATGLLDTADPTKGAGRAAKAAKRVVAKAKGGLRGDIEQAVAQVDTPKEVSVPKRFKGGEKEGIYRGTESFGGITPQKLGGMRKDYLEHMERGAGQRDWYDRTSATNLDLAGGDIAKADKLADIESITSSRTPVGANLMYSARGLNQDLVGDPVKTGGFPNAMGKTIEDTWAEGSGGQGLGMKRSPYRAGLSVAWNGPESVKRATHDIHDVRAWGIEDPITGGPWSKGVPEAGHRFLDEQAQYVVDKANAQKLADLEDWKLHNAQAAAWISQKSKRKGMTVEDAGKDYTDFVPDYSAQVTREWTPGATSGHMPEMLRAEEPIRREYADQMEGTVAGRAGIDRLANEMGAYTSPTLANRGIYEGQTNPGYATQLLVGKEGGGTGLDPASQRVAKSVAGAHGLIGLQDQSAFNYLGGESPIKRAGAFQVATGRPMSEAGLANVSRIAEQFGGDVAQVDPRGARVMSFHDEGDPQRAALIKALREEYPHADVTPQARDSTLFPLKEGSFWEKPEKFSTKPYIAAIEEGGPKMVAGFDKAMQSMAPQQLAVTEAIAAKHGFTQAPFYRPMMEALSTGGLAALKDLVAKGIVPVAAFAAIAEALQGQGQEEMQ